METRIVHSRVEAIRPRPIHFHWPSFAWADEGQNSGWRRVLVNGPVRQLAMGLEELADGFRWQGDGVASAHATLRSLAP
jgi:hypothetical protein